jgi:gluconolactonase
MISAEKVRGDFQFLEGPVWVPSRNELLFSDIPASRIYRYAPATNSFSVFREPSGQANGNALDPQGRLVTCEHENRRTSRICRTPATPTGANSVSKERFPL